MYKSEPELTTVKEELDEVNGEDKDKNDMTAENIDTATKGSEILAETFLYLYETSNSYDDCLTQQYRSTQWALFPRGANLP